jgi:hypothetical protein
VIIDDVTPEVAQIHAEQASEPRVSLFRVLALSQTVRAALSVQLLEKFAKISKIQGIY